VRQEAVMVARVLDGARESALSVRGVSSITASSDISLVQMLPS